MERTLSLEDKQELMDHFFLERSKYSQEQITELLQLTGLEDLDAILKKNKLGSLHKSFMPLKNLLHLSSLFYGSDISKPIEKRVELPDENGDYKFIVASVIPRSFVNTDPRIILRATKDGFHREILAGVKKELIPNLAEAFTHETNQKDILNFSVEMRGGGRVHINGKHLTFTQESNQFGTISNQFIERLLQDKQKDGCDISVDLYGQKKFFEE